MANRRTPDSRQTPPTALPPAALADVKATKAPPAAPAKKSAKRVQISAAIATPDPVVEAALEAALDAAAAAPAPKARKRGAKAPAAEAAPPASQQVIGATHVPAVSEDERRGMIALAAFVRGERRGFAPGGEAEDWLLAEKEVDALLSSGQGPTQ
jgi:Protein of unknown function (DUF2934)